MKRLSNWELAGTVTYIASILFAILIAISFSGCGSECGGGLGSCIEIGDVPEEAELECRTISVDRCFAVQCGYQEEPGLFLVVANELFCPEDFCEEPPPICYTRDEAREHDRRLCLTCMNNVECPDTDVVEPGDDGYCDLSVPVGHRPIECRGKDHAR